MTATRIARLLSADPPTSTTAIHVASCDDVPGVAVVTLNRPATHNALRRAMWTELPTS